MAQESVVHRPHPTLRPFVAGAVGYRQAGLPPGLHRGLPSPHLTFVVTLDEPLVMAAHPDPAQHPGSYSALLGGLHTRPALISHPGRQAGVQLSLTPLGARALLGVPAGALASLDCPVEVVLMRRALAARVGRGDPPDLAALAAGCGYADQAHLTREWQAFSGLAPTRWLAAEVHFVQDETPVGAGGSLA